MKTIHKDIVSVLVFSRDGKFLQGRKDPKRGGVYAECWHLPGGRVGEGESKDDALVREIKEEVGIDIIPYGYTLIDDIGRGEAVDTEEGVIRTMNFYVYKVTITDKDSSEIDVTLSDDLVEYRWADINSLVSAELTPPSVELFTRLGYLK